MAESNTNVKTIRQNIAVLYSGYESFPSSLMRWYVTLRAHTGELQMEFHSVFDLVEVCGRSAAWDLILLESLAFLMYFIIFLSTVGQRSSTEVVVFDQLRIGLQHRAHRTSQVLLHPAK